MNDTGFKISKRPDVIADVTVYVLIFLYILFIAVVSTNREFYNYHTETDFLGGFVPEAQRILNGQSLLINFHPPFYAGLIAGIYAVTGNWLKAGILISLVSSLLLMLASYQFFKKTFGTFEAVGSIIILLLSPVFLSYSMVATSDVFAIAIVMIAFYMMAKAHDLKNQKWVFMTGLVIGISILTRTNAIALLGFMLFYISIQNYKLRIDKKLFVFVFGVSIPLIIWLAIAMISNSPFAPTRNYQNLALTYYAENDRISGDALSKVSDKFESSAEVLLSNPMHTGRIYIRDLRNIPRKMSSHSDLLKFPLAQFALPGLLYFIMIYMFRNQFYFVIFLNVLFMLLLLNFKAYEARFYIYLLPFIGAGVAHTARYLYNGLTRSNYLPRVILVVVAAALIVANGASAIFDAYAYQNNYLSSDSYAASMCLEKSTNSVDDIVIARKPHAPFYAQMRAVMFPDANTVEQLEEKVYSGIYDPNRNNYLFYGFSESKYRKELRPAMLLNPDSIPWLEKICSGEEEGGWVLFRIKDR